MSEITRSIIVKADVETAFNAWCNFDNFPMFMKHVKSVNNTGNGKSHWEVSGPLGKTVEWEAEITRLEPNKRIGWSTKDREGDLTTSGQVSFNALPAGTTEVTVIFHFVPKAGIAGDIIAGLFANPDKKIEEDLGNFKSYIEGMYDRTTR
jgi:uncharacterized membrane protein